jgi:hypothetical protein
VAGEGEMTGPYVIIECQLDHSRLEHGVHTPLHPIESAASRLILSRRKHSPLFHYRVNPTFRAGRRLGTLSATHGCRRRQTLAIAYADPQRETSIETRLPFRRESGGHGGRRRCSLENLQAEMSVEAVRPETHVRSESVRTGGFGEPRMCPVGLDRPLSDQLVLGDQLVDQHGISRLKHSMPRIE